MVLTNRYKINPVLLIGISKINYIHLSIQLEEFQYSYDIFSFVRNCTNKRSWWDSICGVKLWVALTAEGNFKVMLVEKKFSLILYRIGLQNYKAQTFNVFIVGSVNLSQSFVLTDIRVNFNNFPSLLNLESTQIDHKFNLNVVRYVRFGIYN